MKNALITGANKGIGFETARQLLQNGYYVYLGCRNSKNGHTAVDEMKKQGFSNVEFIQLDVTDDESVKEARKELGKKTNVIDALINNAGISGGLPQTALDSSLQRFRDVFEVNFYGVISVTQAFFDLLNNSPEPRIVNVTSSSASLTLQNDPGWKYYEHKAAIYTTSKTALNMYTVNLAYDLGDTPFKVNAVCPGYTGTDFNDYNGTGSVAEAGTRIAKYAMIEKDGPSGQFISEEYNTASGMIPW